MIDLKKIQDDAELFISELVLKNVQPEIERVCKKYNIGYSSGMGTWSWSDLGGIELDDSDSHLFNFDDHCETLRDEGEYFDYTLGHFVEMKGCMEEVAKLNEILGENIVGTQEISWYTYSCNKAIVKTVHPRAWM